MKQRFISEIEDSFYRVQKETESSKDIVFNATSCLKNKNKKLRNKQDFIWCLPLMMTYIWVKKLQPYFWSAQCIRLKLLFGRIHSIFLCEHCAICTQKNHRLLSNSWMDRCRIVYSMFIVHMGECISLLYTDGLDFGFICDLFHGESFGGSVKRGHLFPIKALRLHYCSCDLKIIESFQYFL